MKEQEDRVVKNYIKNWIIEYVMIMVAGEKKINLAAVEEKNKWTVMTSLRLAKNIEF